MLAKHSLGRTAEQKKHCAGVTCQVDLASRAQSY